MKNKITIIGTGKMGEALISGLLHSKKFDVSASTRSKQNAEEIKKKYKIQCHTDNLKAIQSSDIVVIAVKPYQAKEVLNQCSKQLSKNKLLISVCAAINTELLQEWSGRKCAVIRTMPNTPCLINEGMTVLTAAEGVNSDQIDVAHEIFNTVGKTAFVEEHLMDAVTGLSGCGPAYMYLIIEAMSEAGVKVGLPRKVATLLSAQTMLGSAKMLLDRGVHPAELKDEVTTPAGVTVDGLMALEEGALRSTMIKAVVAATKKSANIGGQKSSKSKK